MPAPNLSQAIAQAFQNSTPTLAEVIRDAIEARLEDVYTARPGRVLSFDESTCTAVIQPSVKRGYTNELGARAVTICPPLPGIPVLFYGSGPSYGITFPIEQGETGLLVTCECSLDKFKSSAGRDVDPQDDRRHHLSDSVFILGLRPKSLARSGTSTRIAADTMTLHAPNIKLGGHLGMSPVARKTDLDIIMSALDVASNILDLVVSPAPAVLAAKTAKLAITTFKTALEGLNFPTCSQYVESK
jgi:hypothetical protein